MYCERCCCEVSDERDLYEFVDFMICEECLDMLLNGTSDSYDELDDLVEQLNNMDTE